MRIFVWLSLVCVFVQFVGAQEIGPIYLKNELVPRTTIQRNTIPSTWPQNNCLADSPCYAILQLEHIPNDEEKRLLAQQGIVLHHYIPTRAYLASYSGPSELSLPPLVVQLVPLEPHQKCPAPVLEIADYPDKTVTYELLARPFPGMSALALAQELEQLGAKAVIVEGEVVQYSITPDLMRTVLACPALQYTEPVPAEPVAEGDVGRGSSRIPVIDPDTGLGYNGNGIAIGIGDDGAVHHLDFYGRMVDHTQYDSGSHAEMTTGMATGAGNIDPTTQGTGWGATLHLFDIAADEHLDLAPQHFVEYGIAITSTSFGEGCGDAYDGSTRDIDAQVYNHPYLAHVFSAGNHGTEPCYNIYSWLGANAAGNYYATITGGRKAGKNVLAVGNVEWNDLLLASSSRGPTPDGRIKPDLSALGQFDRTTGPDNTYRFSSGTSAAAPNVAGVLAILYEQYLATHAGTYPSSALIKGVVLNTADDLGPAGPDYHYGWGRINARRALHALENNQFFSGSVAHGGHQQFQINVPAGAKNLKVMLSWHDPAGSVLSSVALVNDLELHLQHPQGTFLSPWVPSTVAHLDSLQRPALPGEDHRNNVEQVAVANPTAGTYQIHVDGLEIPEGPQEYFLTYTYEVEEMEMLSPAAGATYVPGELALLTWDAVNTGESFSLEYSTNAGQSWQYIATDLAPSTHSFQWNVPQIATDRLQIRLRRAGQISSSGHEAVVAQTPVFTTTYLDAETALLDWDPIAGAIAYKIFALGEKYMEVIGATVSTSYEMDAEVGEGYWLSVAPVFPSTLQGRRANAQYYEHFGCESNVTLAFQFDRYPGETGWYILDADGSIRASGGPYVGQPSFSYLEEVICLPPGCFTLVVTDTYNDGMCCDNGDGWYQLTDVAGNVMASGSSFGNISYGVFCVDPNATAPFSISASVVSEINCAGASTGLARVNATGGSGNYTYSWSNGASSSTISNLSAGTYQVTVSDGTEQLTTSVTLQAPPAIQISSVVTPSTCGDGRIVMSVHGGTPPYTLNWADGGHSWIRNGLLAGNYFVLVQDANGCQQTHSVAVAQANPLTLSLNIAALPSCNNPIGGHITASVSGGTAPYQYQWSTGATGVAQLQNLTPGTYSLTVTSGSCSVQQSITVTSPSAIQVQEASAPPRCADSNDGWIALTVTGGTAPYVYQWSDGGLDAHRYNLSDGVYLVTITDAAGCSLIRGFPLESPEALQLSVEVQHVTEENNGIIEMDIQGGTPPYFVSWNNGAESLSIYDLAPGQYVALVSDANACSTSTVITVDDHSGSGDMPDYCASQGASTNYEWIEAIELNGANYTSGNDGGYGDYVDLILPMIAGQTQQLELIPAYTSTPYNENWRVWIDYNADGDFSDPGEQVATAGPTTGAVGVSFVPPAGLSGQTRMRIAMRYGSSPTPCSNVGYGEVEDYTIIWDGTNNSSGTTMGLQMSGTQSQSDLDAQEWLLYPNPARESVQLSGFSSVEESVMVEIYNQQGKLMRQQKSLLYQGENQLPLALDELTPGLYFVVIRAKAWTQHLRLIKQ